MVKVRFLKMSAAGQTEWDPVVQGGGVQKKHWYQISLNLEKF